MSAEREGRRPNGSHQLDSCSRITDSAFYRHLERVPNHHLPAECSMSHRLKAVIVLLLTPVAARAEEWKSPDGAIAVAVPNPARFKAQVDLPPKLVMAWQSEDQTMLMMVIALPTPPGPPPKDTARAKADYEVGFRRELNAQYANAKLLHSAVELRDGHEVFVLSGQGEKDGTTDYVTQAVTIIPGKGYVVAVRGFGIDTRTDPDAAKFIASFKVLAPARVAPSQPVPSAPGPNSDQKRPVNQIAYNAGQIAGICLFIAGVAWVINRLTRSTTKEPRSRRGRPERDRRHDDDEDA